MRKISLKSVASVTVAIMLMVTAAFAVSDVWASEASTTKAGAKDKKPKTVEINIIVNSEKDAEIELTVANITKKKTSSIMRTVELKSGNNYFTYNKGKKGKYQVTVGAYGDTLKQTVTAVQGKYTVYFQVAPPKDGDAKKTKPIQYKDLTEIKKKK